MWTSESFRSIWKIRSQFQISDTSAVFLDRIQEVLINKLAFLVLLSLWFVCMIRAGAVLLVLCIQRLPTEFVYLLMLR